MVWAFAPLWTGCSAVEPVADPHTGGESYLRLDVEPSTAEIYLDGDYHGTVDRWRGGVVPLQPGDRRLELRADGYVTQRFDLEVGEGRELTLRVQMERDIGAPVDLQQRDEDHPGPSEEPIPVPEKPDELQ